MQSKNIFLCTSLIFFITFICDLFLSKKKISNHFSYSFEKVIVEKYEKTIDKMDWNIFKDTYKKLYNREPKKLKFKKIYKKLKKVEKKFSKYRKIGVIFCLIFSLILLRNEYQKISKKINILFFCILNFINILFTAIFSILTFIFIIYCFFIIFTDKTIRKYYSGIPYVEGVYADIFNFDDNNGVEKRAKIHIFLDLVIIINFFIVIYFTKNVYYNKKYNNEDEKEEEKKQDEELHNLIYCDENQVKKWI
jgi:hypothetical protein